MQNETQNQDTNTQVAQEESPAQNETPQNNQDIGAPDHSTFEAPELVVPSTEGHETVDQVLPLGTDSEPADIDPAVTMTSEDLVGSDPKVTMNPEDIVNPETVEEAGIEEDVVDWTDWNPYLDDEWGATDWDEIGSRTPEYVPELFEDEPSIEENPEGEPDIVYPDNVPEDIFDPDPAATTGIIVDPIPTEPTNTGVVPPWLQEASNPLPTESEDSHNHGDQEENGDTTAGGYDGSGIAGGLDLDQNGVFDRIETNPDDVSEEEYTYDEGAYEDAEDALEDLQDALRDGDEEDRAEALEELQDYLGGFDKGDDEDQDGTETQDAQIHIQDWVDTDGDDQDDREQDYDSDGLPGWVDADGDVPLENMPEAESDPAEVDYQEVLDDLDSGNLNEVREFLEGLAGGNDDEEEAQDAHDDAVNNPDVSDDEDYAYDEGVYEDAEGALKDLQNALKDGDEEDRAEALEELQGYLGGFDRGDEEDQDQTDQVDSEDPYGGRDTDGDAIPDYMDSDSPHQIGEWVSGINGDVWVPFNGEGDDSPENPEAPDASGAAVSGAAIGGAAVGAGAVGEADVLGETTQDLGEALGIDGAGDVIDTVVNGDFDQVLDGAAEWAGDAIDDALGIEGSGEILDHVANGDFEEAFDSAVETAVDAAGEVLEDVVDGIGDAAEDLWDSIW